MTYRVITALFLATGTTIWLIAGRWISAALWMVMCWMMAGILKDRDD